MIIRLLMVLTIGMALIFFIGGGLRDNSMQQFVAGSAVLIGLMPSGLFLTISLAYTLSAVNIAHAGALVQQSQAVESLNYVDVLCMDKTGTLTTNALQLHTVQPLGRTTAAELKRLLGDFACSASTTNATTNALRQGVAGRQRQPVDEVPFASVRKWSALALDDQHDVQDYVVAAIGASAASIRSR